jgi:hypothetical protein
VCAVFTILCRCLQAEEAAGDKPSVDQSINKKPVAGPVQQEEQDNKAAGGEAAAAAAAAENLDEAAAADAEQAGSVASGKAAGNAQLADAPTAHSKHKSNAAKAAAAAAAEQDARRQKLDQKALTLMAETEAESAAAERLLSPEVQAVLNELAAQRAADLIAAAALAYEQGLQDEGSAEEDDDFGIGVRHCCCIRWNMHSYRLVDLQRLYGRRSTVTVA